MAKSLVAAATLFVTLALASSACGSGAYCQSGPVHGTQCYSSTEVVGGNAPAVKDPGSLLNPNEVHPPTPTRYHTTPNDGGVSWSK